MKKYNIQKSIYKSEGLRFGFQAIFHKKNFGKYPENVAAYSPFELVIWFAKYQIALSLIRRLNKNG